MSNHWQEAQEQARREGCGNFVFTSDKRACIAGAPDRGWIILSLQHNLQLISQTSQGVELVLQDLGLPALGWD